MSCLPFLIQHCCLYVLWLCSPPLCTCRFKQRRSRLTVLLILSVNLLLLYITQTASSYAQGGTLLCWIFLIPAHYFNLSVFLSIGLEGISLYYTVVNVFQKEVSNFRLKALLLVQGTWLSCEVGNEWQKSVPRGKWLAMQCVGV